MRIICALPRSFNAESGCYAGSMASDGEADVYALVVGATIAQLRVRHGLTQGELASRIGATQPTISRIERGQAQAGPFELRGLAEAFGMSTAQLTALVDEAYARAERAANEEVKGPAQGEWWRTALTVLGGMGLAGLAGFAAAATLSRLDAKPDETPKKPRKR